MNNAPAWTQINLPTIDEQEELAFSSIVGRVEKLQKEILSGRRDPESWHCDEDDLYVDVLKYHAERGCRIAAEALKINEMEHTRWYA